MSIRANTGYCIILMTFETPSLYIGSTAACRMLGLIHAVAIVFVAVLSKGLAGAVCVLEDDGGVHDAVEHGGLDGRVVYHVLEDDFLPYTQGLWELPTAHVVAAQTTVAAQPVDVPLLCVGL